VRIGQDHYLGESRLGARVFFSSGEQFRATGARSFVNCWEAQSGWQTTQSREFARDGATALVGDASALPADPREKAAGASD
jgi:hypothetical protein